MPHILDLRRISMERNMSFDAGQLTTVTVHLAWAQLEIFADDVDKFQVMAAGDDNSVNDLRIVQNGGELLVEQPQYGLSLNILDSKWLQVCVRMPRTWVGTVRANTISGMLSARKLTAGELALETVSGELRATRLTASQLALKTISGDLRGEELKAVHLGVRNVSGDTALDALKVETLKCNSVSGEQTYNMAESFRTVDITTVSGNVIITSPVETMNASLRSISGKMRTEGVSLTEDTSIPTVRITGVSADLKLISIKE